MHDVLSEENGVDNIYVSIRVGVRLSSVATIPAKKGPPLPSVRLPHLVPQAYGEMRTLMTSVMYATMDYGSHCSSPSTE